MEDVLGWAYIEGMLSLMGGGDGTEIWEKGLKLM